MTTEKRTRNAQQKESTKRGSPAKVNYGLMGGIFFCILLFKTCGGLTIPLPPSDRTPPTITWVFQNETKGTKLVLIEGSGGPIEVGVNDKVAVFCAAKDKDGGVHKLELRLSFGGLCADGLNQTGDPLLKPNAAVFLAGETKISEPQNNKVKTQLTLTKGVTPFSITCGKSDNNEDYHVWKGTLTFTATAENHHAGTTQEELKLAVKP